MEAVISCVKCKAPLVSVEDAGTVRVPFNTGGMTPCPDCGNGTMVELYPAMFHPVGTGSAGERIASPEEAACFYHPQKRASVPCDSCGRFLCALCDVELNGQHLCPNCIQSGKKKGKLKNLENERVLYDRVALGAAILPVLTIIFWFLTIVTAPIALFIAIRHWKSPSSIVPRYTKTRFVIAIILSLLQIGGWTAWIVYLFNRR